MLVGRRAETEAIDRLLADAHDGRSGVLVVRGEAGIGKSALLAYAAEHAGGMTVLRGLGIESESELAFAGLHQLLRPVFDRIDRLPEPQAAALRAAFALSAETVDDRFRVALGVLGLLSEAADERPLLCVVDDAQWLDQASTDALLFAVRRLEAEQVVVVFAARDDHARPFAAPGLPELHLAGLDSADARALAVDRLGADGTPQAVDWLIESAHGNPLALIELAASAPSGAYVPPTTSVEQTYLERIGRLPADVRHLLAVAAAEEVGDRATIVRAAAELGLDANALAAAEAEGLVRVGPDTVEFHHPLVRSAAYRGAGFVERERAHRALAAALADEADADRRAWHRAAATVGVDDEVAAELEQTAARARTRGGHGAAASALARAADLSTDDAERGRRLVLAAAAANLTGDAGRTFALADRAEPLVADPILRADLAGARASAEYLHGRPADASRLFADAAEAVTPHDSGRALELCVTAVEAATMAGDPALFARAHKIGAAIEPDPADDRQVLFSLMFEAGTRVLGGDLAGGAPLFREVLVRFTESDDPRDNLWAGIIAVLLGDDAEALPHYARAVSRAREAGALGVLVRALAHLSTRNFLCGFVSEASGQADEAVRLGRDLGAEHWTAQPLALLAWIAGLQGREQECRDQVERVLELSRPNGRVLPIVTATWALGELELGLGRWNEALGHFATVFEIQAGFGNRRVASAGVASYVEAAFRAGRPEAAEAPLLALERWVEHTQTPVGRPLLERCRGMLATSGEEATAHFEEAVRLHEDGVYLYERARTELLYGEHLRRQKKRSDARVHLRAALQAFEELGAVRWAERARGELRATGETARKRDPSTLGQLTPQELQIARLVGEGASNKEVAAQLFLSPRTVEYHLRKVFTKLGIASRAELIRKGVGAELAAVS